MPWSFNSSGNLGGFNMQSSGNPGGMQMLPIIIRDGLVLYLDAGNPSSYPGSGTTWTDISGNSRNGTLVGTPTFDNQNGGSIVFSGDDSTDLGTFFNFTTFTISLWVNPGSTQVQFANIFDNNHSGTQNFVCQQDSGTVNRYIFYCLNSTNSSTATFNLTANTWQQLTCTWNNSVASVHINGTLIASGSPANPIRYNVQSLRIGRWGGGSGLNARHFNGRVANFWAYNRTLSADEISQNFNNTRSRFGI